MFLQYWQIKAAMDAAKKSNPKSLVGSRVNYQFIHDTEDKKNDGICGLYGWIYEHKNPTAPDTEPLQLVVAFDTTIDEFYVPHEVTATFSREQHLPESTSINQFPYGKEIDDTVYGS